MEIIVSIFIGILYATGVYLLIRRSIVKLILGIIFISNATNLLLFVSGGVTRKSPAFVESTDPGLLSKSTDPLPQALILTALVIGFGIIAFTLILKYKYHQATGTNDLDQAKETDRI